LTARAGANMIAIFLPTYYFSFHSHIIYIIFISHKTRILKNCISENVSAKKRTCKILISQQLSCAKEEITTVDSSL